MKIGQSKRIDLGKKVFSKLCLVSGLMLPLLAGAQQSVAVGGQNMIIEEIRCEGNTNLDCSFIRLKFYQKVGDIAEATEIADARRRLNNVPQFYSAQSRLEQGSKEGTVVVVFSVTEIPTLNFSASANVDAMNRNTDSSFGSYESSSTSASGQVGITHNNIFNRGKLLNFSVGGTAAKIDEDYDVRLMPPLDAGSSRVKSEREFESISYNLNYFDPHLLGSERNFMALGMAYSRNHYELKSYEVFGSPTPFTPITLVGTETSSMSYSATFGRRLGRFSYLDLRYDRSESDFEFGESFDNDSYSLGYGFNREDNAIFATSGDRLDARLARNDSTDRVDLGYSRNFAISGNQVFNVGGGASYSVFSPFEDYEERNTMYYLDARYSHAGLLALNQGRFSAWYVGARITGFDNDFDNGEESFSIRAGYRKIFKGFDLDIGLSYSIDEDIF